MYEMTRGEATLKVVLPLRTLTLKGNGMLLEDDEKRELLKRARAAIESELSGAPMAQIPNPSPHLLEPSGLFVTLRHNGELCGCIGYVEPRLPLCRAAEEIAKKAAFEDPRFPPLTIDEAGDVEIEISVLSPLEEVRDIGAIELGKHGLVIEAGIRRGLLLPHVAVEYNWSREEFLGHVAQKAGLPPESWRQRDNRMYMFTTNTFSESELYDLH